MGSVFFFSVVSSLNPDPGASEAFGWLAAPTPLTHSNAGRMVCDSESYWFNQSLDLEDVTWIRTRHQRAGSQRHDVSCYFSLDAAVCDSVCEEVRAKFKCSSCLCRSCQTLLSVPFDSKRVYVIHLSLTLRSVLKSLSVCSGQQ